MATQSEQKTDSTEETDHRKAAKNALVVLAAEMMEQYGLGSKSDEIEQRLMHSNNVALTVDAIVDTLETVDEVSSQLKINALKRFRENLEAYEQIIEEVEDKKIRDKLRKFTDGLEGIDTLQKEKMLQVANLMLGQQSVRAGDPLPPPDPPDEVHVVEGRVVRGKSS